MRKFVGTLLVLVALTAAAGAQERASWEPKRTWVYFVGLLEWQHPEFFASFPQENRRDEILLDVLRERGVPESQIFFLKDRQATIARVNETFPRFLRRARPGDTVIVYFCGHGYQSEDYSRTYFVTYDANEEKMGWDVRDIPESIERNFRGSSAILLADNCFSGALADAVKARETQSRVSYTVMTSSSGDSSSTGNWTFTESLIYGFRGESFVDDNADGFVTFAEIQANAAEDMLFGEEQVAQFLFTGDSDPQEVVATSVKVAAPRVGERIEAYSVDGYYKGFIIDTRKGQYKIRFYGYEESDDEWVPASKVRRAVPKQFKVGTLVKVETDGQWHSARVVAVKGGAHYVKYRKSGARLGEWVSSDRIRPASH